jgi:hypothetical protein
LHHEYQYHQGLALRHLLSSKRELQRRVILLFTGGAELTTCRSHHDVNNDVVTLRHLTRLFGG